MALTFRYKGDVVMEEKLDLNYDEFRTINTTRTRTTLVLKITNRCPQKCDYCYHLYNNSEDLNKEMDIKTLKEALLKIAPAFGSVDIHLHGGEPLTVNKEKLEEIFKFVSEYRESQKDKQKVCVAIQTNLLLLDEDHVKLFKKYNISVSTSYDGKITDEIRHYSHNDFLNKLDILDGKCGIINVVTKKTIENSTEHIHDLAKQFESPVLCNPVFPFCCSPADRLEPGQYSKYIIERFEYMVENNIKPSWDVMRYFKPVVGGPRDCFCDICLNSIFTITPSGNIKGCDVRNDKEWIYGNLSEINNVYDIYQLPGYVNFEKMYHKYYNSCKKCDYFKYCKGGCLNRVTLFDNQFGKESYCYDIKILIQYFIDYYEKHNNNIDNLPEILKNEFRDWRK